MDVKFLIFKGKDRKKIKRFQYTAIYDATRVRALKVYLRHTQANAIDFVDHIIEKFPFRIQQIRADNGHEFQAKFHWHVEDKGIRHAYIKPSSPQLNGKVERSHRSDQQEFYQLLSQKGDIDLEAKLDEWERFYNFARPHGAFNAPPLRSPQRKVIKVKSGVSPISPCYTRGDQSACGRLSFKMMLVHRMERLVATPTIKERETSTPAPIVPQYAKAPSKAAVA